MFRSFLEIIYLLTLLFLSYYYYKLFLNVVKLRRKTKTTLGFHDIKLQRAIRAHANFSETVPIILIMSLILYFNNLLLVAVPVVLILSIGRVIHSKAISNKNENIENRRLGMKLTHYSMILGALGIIFYISQLIYFSFKATIYTT